MKFRCAILENTSIQGLVNPIGSKAWVSCLLLVGVSLLGWALRAQTWRCSGALQPEMGIVYTGIYAKFKCAAWELSSIQGLLSPMGS